MRSASMNEVEETGFAYWESLGGLSVECVLRTCLEQFASMIKRHSEGVIRLVGSLMLESNREVATRQGRCMGLESSSTLFYCAVREAAAMSN